MPIADPSGLAQILEPLSTEEFLRSHFSTCTKLIQGSAGRFDNLFSWEAMNDILTHHRLDYPQLRLIRQGQTLDPNTYLERRTGRRGGSYTMVLTDRLETEVRAGAALHLSSLHELYAPLGALASSVAASLNANTFVSAHAGLTASKGFDTHWDGHDVFVLQVAGSKYWRLYGVTELAPLAVAPSEKGAGPGHAVWEGMLNEGDVLYIPRGVWHSAQAVDGPTLHLSLGVVNPTMLDYMTWLLTQLAQHEQFRIDLPQFSGSEVLSQHLLECKKLLNRMNSLENVTAFLAATDAVRQPRYRPHLPERGHHVTTS